MGYGVKIRVWGDYACFTRPEMKVERVSYDMMTPSAARGIIEAIYWKPAIKWTIDKIHVINPIRFTNVRRNEVSEVAKLGSIKKAMDQSEPYHIIAPENRHQRAALILRDVEYVIEAHFDLNKEKAGETDTVEKHYNIALRRLRQGQYFHHPSLGTREFGASFELIEDETAVPKSKIIGDVDLGYMLYDMNFTLDESKTKQTVNPSFFRAKLEDGVLNLSKVRNEVKI
ncbi:type I-C CRISPR-associated protein Cas5 [Acetobacterium paludosum]|uniref:pre-crRNA processing endonuclease n=1 Tax=Acetobacterium paludosum TaxID=52693 RepID=A0A923KPI9_9FIRM|nr:type I-C CRISPR-associated protein Cas5c [Acetobacterium paludosum]MBC3888184.1 type I-C CRISPR-associated protein Cas5 [Acetobacterium paludosum]